MYNAEEMIEIVPFTAIAERALAKYRLEGAALTFIRHSDNVTFKMERARRLPAAQARQCVL